LQSSAVALKDIDQRRQRPCHHRGGHVHRGQGGQPMETGFHRSPSGGPPICLETNSGYRSSYPTGSRWRLQRPDLDDDRAGQNKPGWRAVQVKGLVMGNTLLVASITACGNLKTLTLTPAPTDVQPTGMGWVYNFRRVAGFWCTFALPEKNSGTIWTPDQGEIL